MDIATLAMSMKQTELMHDVSLAMTKKTMEFQEENTEQKPEDPKDGPGIKKEPEESGQPALQEQEETAAATGNSAVKTGDNSSIWLWLGIAVAMLAIMRITTRASSR